MKKAIIVILLIFLVIAGIIGGVMGYKYYTHHNMKNPEGTVYSFVQAVNDQNLNDMLDCIDKTEVKYIKKGAEFIGDKIGTENLSKITTWLPFMSAFADIQMWPKFDLEIQNSKIEEDSADIKVELTNLNDEKKTEYEFHLEKDVDDKWYIHLITI